MGNGGRQQVAAAAAAADVHADGVCSGKHENRKTQQ